MLSSPPGSSTVTARELTQPSEVDISKERGAEEEGGREGGEAKKRRERAPFAMAAVTAAQAPEPQERVSPLPRSHTLIFNVSLAVDIAHQKTQEGETGKENLHMVHKEKGKGGGEKGER